MKFTLGQMFLDAANRDFSKVTFWQMKGEHLSISYGLLAQQALQVAGALQKLGLQKQDRVAIVLPTGPDFYRAFFGVILAGGVPAALYPPVRLGKIDEWKMRTTQMLDAISSQIVLSDNSLFPLLGVPVEKAKNPTRCFTVKNLQEMQTAGGFVDSDPDQVGIIQFSSGSTGQPKPVGLTHRNVLKNTEAILAKIQAQGDPIRLVSWLPLYHDMGLIGCVMTQVVGGGHMTLIKPDDFIGRPRTWLEAITRDRANTIVAPNFAYSLCAERITETQLGGLDLSSIRIALCGAEPVHQKSMSSFANRLRSVGFQAEALTPVYGLAEATLAVTFSEIQKAAEWTYFDRETLEAEGHAVPLEATNDQAVCLASVGKPLDETWIEIRNAECAPLPEQQIGAVWVKGPAVMSGYLGMPLESGKILENGWLNTGDRGFIYKGNLYICGRNKDIIIIRGRNYDPSLIEQSVYGVRGLRTGCVAAFGCADDIQGTERLVVLAEYREDDFVKVDQNGAPVRFDEALNLIQAEVTTRIQSVCGLKVSEVCLLRPGSIPRTSSGKIRRQEAKRQWMIEALTTGRRPGLGLMMRETVVGMMHHLKTNLLR